MPTSSPPFTQVLQVFAAAFTRPTFDHALTLITGTLLASGRRTVTAALRAVGLQDDQHFTTYHRVLNRAVWSPLLLSHLLLTVLLTRLAAAEEPLIVALDDTLERRYGKRVAHKGCYHDAVRSRPGCPMTTTGIRWLAPCGLCSTHNAGHFHLTGTPGAGTSPAGEASIVSPSRGTWSTLIV